MPVPAPGAEPSTARSTSEPPTPDGGTVADGPALPGDGEQRRLSARAVPYWRIELSLVAVVLVVIVFVVLVATGVDDTVAVLCTVAVLVLGVVGVVVVPPVRHRIWWYAIGEEEVDLQQGFLTVTRTVVPMVRVQHVDLHRGPITTRMGLAEIELHTASGSVTIPALDAAEAERIRERVSVLARTPDDL